ncbi:MAG: hypothetical protein PHH58_13915 [Rhodoferax sp.]|nr:hypothetical protein [Rhodoferax sp.]
MKNSFVILTLAATIFSGGCSQQTELDHAKKRITQLESELAAERAKISSTPINESASASSAVPQAQVTVPVPPSPSGDQWIYQAREDKMTGKTVFAATVLSSNTVRFNSPYDGEQNGHLTLRTDPKYGKNVIFSIENGQLLCLSYEDCQVLIRFDDGNPENFSGIGPADNSSETVFIRNYERFIGKLRKAKIVRISTNVYQEGAPVFEFDVSGFSQEKYIHKK